MFTFCEVKKSGKWTPSVYKIVHSRHRATANHIFSASISCDLSLNGNLRGGTRVAYSINVSEFISLLLSLVRWLVICYLERQMETGESEYIDG